jgi:integrase
MPLTKFQRKPGGAWYIRGTVRDQRVYETTSTTDEKAAEAIRIKREAELLDQSIFGRKAVATFEQAALSYIETGRFDRFIGEYDQRTGTWSGVLGHFWGRKLLTIRQADLDRAATKLMPKAKGQSRNRNVYTPFIAVWNHAAKQDMCEPRRWTRPMTVDVDKRRYATLTEVAAMEAAAAPHLRPLLIFLVYTGARLTEALEMQWSDIDLEHRWCVFRETKRHNETRGVPLHARAVAALESVTLPLKKRKAGAVYHRKGPVFLTNKGRPYIDKERRSGGQVKTAWATMCRNAGVEGLTPHSMRHTCATWLLAVGIDEHTRDTILGHTSSEMSRVYADISQQALIEAVDKLPSGANDVQHLSAAWLKSLVKQG